MHSRVKEAAVVPNGKIERRSRLIQFTHEVSMAVSHVTAVRALYKQILLLHRRLPLEMKALGDEYVKAEFRRHKNAKPEEIQNFMREWGGYAAMLSAQTGGVKSEEEIKKVGLHLDGNQLEDMNDMQVGQLYELYQETKKPSQFMQKEDS